MRCRCIRSRWVAPFVVLAITAGGCAEPLVFGDWTIPVPESTRIVEYRDATDADRAGNRIELVEDLVIGPRADDDNYRFYVIGDVLADAAGRIYLFDSGNARVQVFDAGGDYLHTLGGEGSGPGEFRSQGGWITVLTTIAGDRFMAYDMAQSRISVWAADGSHVGDHLVGGLGVGPVLTGLEDGTFIAVGRDRTAEAPHNVVAAYSSGGVSLREYVRLPEPEGFTIGGRRLLNPSGDPRFAAAADGTVYATAGDEYQVLAVAPDGQPRWALRVAHERAPFTDEHRRRALDRLTENSPDLDTADARWPARLGAIGQLAVDGHGHLYVFGFVPPEPFAAAPDEVAVDVYAPNGERLFTGTMPNVRWRDAAGDFVYAVREGPTTAEREPVRYRLVEPFGR
jgi:hypothetical protein